MIGDDRWSDEAGFDATTVTGVAGGIIEAIAELFLAGVVTTDGAIDGSLADPERTHRGRRADVLLRAARCAGAPRLVITQNDVRQISSRRGPCTPGVS